MGTAPGWGEAVAWRHFADELLEGEEAAPVL